MMILSFECIRQRTDTMLTLKQKMLKRIENMNQEKYTKNQKTNYIFLAFDSFWIYILLMPHRHWIHFPVGLFEIIIGLDHESPSYGESSAAVENLL